MKTALFIIMMLITPFVLLFIWSLLIGIFRGQNHLKKLVEDIDENNKRMKLTATGGGSLYKRRLYTKDLR